MQPEEATAALERLLGVTHLSLERRAQLEQALQSRIAIEQAKGVIAERYRLDPEHAFDLIRRASRAHRIKLYRLVEKIRPGADTPPELAEILSEAGIGGRLA